MLIHVKVTDKLCEWHCTNNTREITNRIEAGINPFYMCIIAKSSCHFHFNFLHILFGSSRVFCEQHSNVYSSRIDSVIKASVYLLSLCVQKTQSWILVKFASWFHRLFCTSKVIQGAGPLLLHSSQVFPYKALLDFKKLRSKRLNHICLIQQIN